MPREGGRADEICGELRRHNTRNLSHPTTPGAHEPRPLPMRLQAPLLIALAAATLGVQPRTQQQIQSDFILLSDPQRLPFLFRHLDNDIS